MYLLVICKSILSLSCLSKQKDCKDTITEEDLEFEALEEDDENDQGGKDNYDDRGETGCFPWL